MSGDGVRPTVELSVEDGTFSNWKSEKKGLMKLSNKDI
jgi:hypothetical protein